MRQLNWTEYAIEFALLGAFMLSAALFATLLFHPGSAVMAAIPDATVRRALMGLAMGLTAGAIFYSPLGKRSGAHINPAITLTFFALGRIAKPDAVAYAAAQFAGGFAGIAVAWLFLGSRLADPAVNYVTTVPGPYGAVVAFVAETTIILVLVLVVLETAARPRLSRFTGLCAATMVGLYILIESPLSGMSMNPARTLGSALAARDFSALWVYFTAPPLGALAAAQLYVFAHGRKASPCAKLRHDRRYPCIFCNHADTPATMGTFSPESSLSPHVSGSR